LGRTSRLQVERESFYPREDIAAEITQRNRETDADYVTFVGDGEPTLCSDLGWLIERTKENSRARVAVISNGSIFFRKDVRDDLQQADIVIPTLDAGNEKVFKAINRPHHDIDYATMLQGQVDFRREYSGQLWVEVMLVKNLNDSVRELESIRIAIDRIKPDRVYILTPVRPPAESFVEPSDPETILKAQEMLSEATAIVEQESGEFGLEDFTSAEQAIQEIGSRHPLRLGQALEIQDAFSEPGTVERMIAEETLVKVRYGSGVYLLPARFLRGK
jgi:wyosine [tRNA(Phe)-imidazoG37] synthetase (radical SAM superfamily)